MRVVVDTNIIVKAVKEHEPDHLGVILSIRQKHTLVLDFERRLLGEYEDNLGREALYRKWLKELERQTRIEWSNGHLDNAHRQRLIQLGLHEEEDHVIVALADHTDRYIVTEDSDFGKGDSVRAQAYMGVLSYLTGTMGMTVHTAAEAVLCLW